MIAEIASAVIAAALVGVGGWLAHARFVLRPRVSLAFATGSATSNLGNASTDLTLTWNYALTLANRSKHDALELQVLSVTNGLVSSLPASHLSGLCEMKCPGRLQKQVKREEFVRANKRFWGTLHPPELRDIRLVLRYRNERRLAFYTVYEKHGDAENSTYHLLRPAGTTVEPNSSPAPLH